MCRNIFHIAIFTLLILGWLPNQLYANMASPLDEGSYVTSPFVSEQVDILREELTMTLDSTFSAAAVEVVYHIQANQSGRQIPLLFYAAGLQGGFRVWLDGQEIRLLDMPETYTDLEGSPFEAFQYLFTEQYDHLQVEIKDSPSTGFFIRLEDMRYFEVDLPAGNHEIKVAYTATRWKDRSGWVNTYYIQYILSPASYWRSFGTLDIRLDASRFPNNLSTNLGEAHTGDLATMATWHFEDLPAEILRITYKPAIGKMAEWLVSVSPVGITIGISLLLMVVHLLTMRWYRRRKGPKGTSWATVIGSIAIPLAVLWVYVMAHSWIDGAIGAEAGKYHGYVFLTIYLLPFIFPLYLASMLLIDRIMRNRWAGN